MNAITIQTIFLWLRKLLDLTIVWVLIYYALKVVRNNSRTIQIFKGIFILIVAQFIARFLDLKTVNEIVTMFLSWGFLAIIIIFQPEIRGVLERIGKTSFSRIDSLTGNERLQLIDELVKAADTLSSTRTGALITLEQAHSLNDFVHTGTPMNSLVTAELLEAIFVTTTPLHDGAVIIQGDRIACASAYFPPTALELPPRYGARHRAALGISEITDSITIVVSEETGQISIAEEGHLTPMDAVSLRDFLLRALKHEETEVSRTVRVKAEKKPRRTKVRKPVQKVDAEKVREETQELFSKGVLAAFRGRHKQDPDNKEKQTSQQPIAPLVPPHDADGNLTQTDQQTETNNDAKTSDNKDDQGGDQ